MERALWKAVSDKFVERYRLARKVAEERDNKNIVAVRISIHYQKPQGVRKVVIRLRMGKLTEPQEAREAAKDVREERFGRL